MTYRELLKELKKKAKKKGLLDAEIRGSVLDRAWKYTTYVTLIDPADGEKRHLSFGYIEPLVNHEGEEISPIKIIFKDV